MILGHHCQSEEDVYKSLQPLSRCTQYLERYCRGFYSRKSPNSSPQTKHGLQLHKVWRTKASHLRVRTTKVTARSVDDRAS